MKRKSKKRKIDFKKIIVFVLFLLVLIFAIKLGIKNAFKKEKDANLVEENISEVQNINEEENITENNIQNQQNIEAMNKQRAFKEQKISSGKILGEEGLPVLMYHFFYDESKGEKGQDGNWIEISNFEEQIKYLANNDFYFPTWQEVEDYIDGNQELPEKSVVITVDDGDDSFFELAVPVLQKYNVTATSFVITYWYGDRASNKEKNVDYQSHSNDMHKAGSNGKGVMLSWDYDKIKEDVLLSSEILGGANIFCYPFGQYNDLDIKVLKDTGYKLAFTTQGRKSEKRGFKV